MKVLVDRSLCMGHGRCAVIAPSVFQVDDVGYVVGDEIDVPTGSESDALEGVENCPEGCLTIVEDV